MTTIATDGKSMAADGLITQNDHICMTDCRKIYRLPDGSLVGFCGNSFNWQGFADWLAKDMEGPAPSAEDGFGCLHLRADGTVVSYDKMGRPFPEIAPVALGSGERFALAWMDAGKDAHDAIRYACTRDIYSGGTITVEHLEAHLKQVA